MGKASLEINGRKYALGCDDGEEERLVELGQKTRYTRESLG